MRRAAPLLALLAVAFVCAPAAAQKAPDAYKTASDVEDPVALLGLSVADVLLSFGPPRAVHASRGAQEWQDDVVFEYQGADFYFFNDRVWQVSPRRAGAVGVGDSKLTLAMVYGEAAVDKGSYIVAEVPERAWKTEIRYDIDAAGKVSKIYVYRADY
ncbi:MAG: hypothetical protein LBS82_00820 [Spirochaetaceae bacterium]|jgi:hypothetical protein|nr:hypothetical protein [Spirochaetaceae bacterium]